MCLCLEFKTSATRHLSSIIENLGESFSFSISSYFLLLNTRDFPIISHLIFFLLRRLFLISSLGSTKNSQVFFLATMYGLLLQSGIEIIRAKYGQETWEQIKNMLHLELNSFSAFQQYGETLFVRIAKLLSEVRSKY